MVGKNVILLTIDCLRASNLNCYGYARETSKNIDLLAGRGRVFKNAYANGPFTCASFPSILASVYPLDAQRMLPLSPDVRILPQFLDGIKTAGITSNPYLSSYYGFNRGWDFFEDFIKTKKTPKRQGKDVLGLLKKAIPPTLRAAVRTFTSTSNFYEDAGTITGLGIDWLAKNSESDFFMWLHYMDLHEPYKLLGTNIPQKYSANISINDQRKVLELKKEHKTLKNIVDIYDDKLLYVDQKIGELNEFLMESGLSERTTIILTADHGQEFYEHGRFGHSARFYNEILHIPLIICGPGVTPGIDNGLVMQIDIAPTILGLYNKQIPREFKGLNLFGEDRHQYVLSETRHDKDGVYIKNNTFYEPNFETYAIQNLKWKFIYSLTNGALFSKEAYDLTSDPEEKINVCAYGCEWVHMLQTKLDEHRTQRIDSERGKINTSIKNITNL